MVVVFSSLTYFGVSVIRVEVQRGRSTPADSGGVRPMAGDPSGGGAPPPRQRAGNGLTGGEATVPGERYRCPVLLPSYVQAYRGGFDAPNLLRA